MEQFKQGQKTYTRLEEHALQGGRVRVTNRAFMSANDYSLGAEVSVGSIDRWSDLASDLLLEVEASKQRSYTMVSDTQMAQQAALEDLVYARILGGALRAGGGYEASFDWDDRIVVDSEAEREQDRNDVAMGAMRLEEYRAKWYGETLEEADSILKADLLFDKKQAQPMNGKAGSLSIRVAFRVAFQ